MLVKEIQELHWKQKVLLDRLVSEKQFWVICKEEAISPNQNSCSCSGGCFLNQSKDRPKGTLLEVLVVVQRVKNMVSTRTEVQSLASLSGLRIRCCCACGVGWQLQLRFDP